MTLVQVAIANVHHLAIALALVGLVLRNRARFCRAFVAYLVAVLTYSIVTVLWPERFFVWSIWLLAQTVFDILKILVAAELTYWTFLGFPGAAQSVRHVVLVFLVGTLIVGLALPSESARDGSGFLLGPLRPRLEIGAVWILTAVAALVQWYRVPLSSLHRGIMLGFVPYLVVFSAVMKLVAEYGWSHWLTTLDPVAYLLTCSWWAWIAWRAEPALQADPLMVARLQPWRVRC